MSQANSDFDAARKLIDNAQKILFTTHERTDGDDLGSVLALAQHCHAAGKEVFLTIKGGVPEGLRYLPFSYRVKEDLPDSEFDLLIVSGCSKLERTGIPAIIESGLPTLNVDHHPDNALYGNVNVVQPEKSAVAEVVYDMFRHFGWRITTDIATCLLTGIFTDTGSFMHSNTKSSTLTAAAELMRRGARPAKVAKHTHKGKNVEGLKAWGKALENAYYDEERKIIYTVMTDEDLQGLNNPPLDYFEGLVETLNKVPEAKFAMFLKQDGDVIKGSLRSDPHKGIDVKQIAGMLGGGGHMWASGFSVAGKLERDSRGKWQIVN